MSSIPIYAAKEDFEVIFDWLSKEEEIAFINQTSPCCWKAVGNYAYQGDRDYCLWHVPSGPLPFIKKDQHYRELYVEDPYVGWTEEVKGDGDQPHFGPNAVGVLTLHARAESTRHIPELSVFKPGIGLSSFGWIGNYYSIIGSPALGTTEKFWGRLGRWIRKIGIPVPRSGPIDQTMKDKVWALPAAYKKIQNGYPRNAEPIE